jgi:hypothetical protein
MTVDNLLVSGGRYLSTSDQQFRYKLRESWRMSFDGDKRLMEHGKNGLYTATAALHNHHKFFKYLISN